MSDNFFYSCHVNPFTFIVIIDVAEPEFVCLMYSEAKQTETLEFGAEKGFLQGPGKENGWLVPKRVELPSSF